MPCTRRWFRSPSAVKPCFCLSTSTPGTLFMYFWERPLCACPRCTTVVTPALFLCRVQHRTAVDLSASLFPFILIVVVANRWVNLPVRGYADVRYVPLRVASNFGHRHSRSSVSYFPSRAARFQPIHDGVFSEVSHTLARAGRARLGELLGEAGEAAAAFLENRGPKHHNPAAPGQLAEGGTGCTRKRLGENAGERRQGATRA